MARAHYRKLSIPKKGKATYTKIKKKAGGKIKTTVKEVSEKRAGRLKKRIENRNLRQKKKQLKNAFVWPKKNKKGGN